MSNVDDLEVKWEFTTGGDVSATPAVVDGTVYFPDRAGNLYALDKWTGQQRWKSSIAAASGVPGDYARATPAIAGNKVIIGTQGPFGGGGKVLAFDKSTGALLWRTTLDNHPAAIITQSATVFGNRVYVGTSSLEETFALLPGYDCCSFRGRFAALDLNTGAVVWELRTAPVGFPGNAVWGSSPAIDSKRGQVYIATGNNYDAPPETLQCVAAAGNDPAAQRACLPADNYFDSVMALDMKTGAIRWITEALGFDAWTVDCIPFIGEGTNCPEPAGPDFDFGQAPALFSVTVGGKKRDVVGAGQKSGQYWALNPDTGAVLWRTQAGPGGTAGGLQWGSAVDGQRVYTTNANSNGVPWTLPNGTTTTDGVISGIDAVTGQLLWQTPPPFGGVPFGGGTSGPATTANGVVFACALDPAGHMYALDGATGAILWTYASGGSCLSGAAISEGRLYWGSGYGFFGTPNNKLYSFGLPG
ncbi:MULTISPECIES: PQQ-binding-like beta-propeller repeat protein [unclassified Nocardioides]|uniref:outer membrane protein assembly factor BamB family protein n=1 Tax=unclassified Nocardioides TaxID=2615069 RepID=UPI00361A3910